MIDVNRQLKIALKTGKLEFGCKSAVNAAGFGKAQLIIIASNCPERFKSEILSNAKLSEIPMYVYSGTSLDLGEACEKPFVIAALVVKEQGDSDILKVVRA